LNHLLSWPKGGFVGVDVFFVISGFLISDHLVRDRAKNGRIDFAGFYMRRVRRIVPAATVTLIATVVATAAIIGSARASQVKTDAIWAFLFANNWHMAAIGTNYFADNVTSPLQHFWSLSVEEQFYFAWPWVILVTYRLARGHRHTWWILCGVMGGLSVASFAYSLWHSQSSPTVAYFSTFDRAWELGVGAVAAMAKPVWARLSARSAGVLAWAGLAGIVVSLFVVKATDFPAPWAALPVLSTAAVIAAGVGHPQHHLMPLTNTVAQYLGDISYSLYLWHFPIIILALAYYPGKGLAYALWCLALSLIVSALSFHLIENPLRTTHFFDNAERRRRLGAQWTLTLTAGVIVAVVLTDRSFQAAGPADASPLPVAHLNTAADAPGLASQQQALVDAALKETSFPKFNPPVSELGLQKWFRDLQGQGFCADVTAANVAKCRTGQAGAKKLAVVYGDSYAMAWTPGVAKALESHGYLVQQITLEQCPAWDVSVKKFDGSAYPECDSWHKWAEKAIAAMHPDMVIMSSTEGSTARLVDQSNRTASIEAGYQRTVQGIGPVGKVITLSPPPVTGDLQQCVTKVGKPADCTTTVSHAWNVQNSAEYAASTAAGKTYVNTLNWFCEDGSCPAFIGATPVMVDGQHLTIQYSESLAPLLSEALVGRDAGPPSHHV
jgi:peptidoglycan/LPS O-acetylase OafA/YrhL